MRCSTVVSSRQGNLRDNRKVGFDSLPDGDHISSAKRSKSLVSISLEVAPPINYVEALRDYGWKVKFQHIRPVTYADGSIHNETLGEIRMYNMQNRILGHGGVTVCSAKKEVNGSVVEVRAEARCSKSDKYVKKVGNHLAAQRLWEFVQ